MSLDEDDFGSAGVGKCGVGGFVEVVGDDGVSLSEVDRFIGRTIRWAAIW